MQHVAKKPSTKTVAVQTRPILQASSTVTPAVQRQQQVQRDLQRFTARPTSVQLQVAAPALRAARLHAQEIGQIAAQQQTVQRQVTALTAALPDGAVQAALQRQAQSSVPVAVIRTPQSPSDWVTVMRQRAEQVEGQRLDPKAYGQFTALQRQVAGQLTTAFKQDRQPAAERHQAFAAHLASLQRHPLSRPVVQVVLGSLPAGERPAIQCAVGEVQEREALQRQQDGQALSLHSLQRQLAELDEQATKPVMERIQARRGSGNPLPAAVQRHLEQGLNHDLSRVRIHDDAEADKLAKGVNAVAFTTGTDIYFRSGKFNPNTKSGLELLAHEVTHTVQQAQGKVGRGIDPDAGLEAEAQSMGSKLARVLPSAKSLMPPSPHAPGVYTKAAALQRAQEGATQAFALKPLYDLQPQAVQRLGNPFKWVGDKVQDGVQAVANKGREMIAGALTQIPGYRELTLAFGKDLVTGKAVAQNPNTILDTLTSWVPGPLKDILKALKETNALPKAWAWFKAELAKLNLAGVLGEVASAIGKADLGAAKTAVTSRIGGLKALIVGSAKKIAEIGLTALAAGLGPVGQGVIAQLRKSGDLIIQVLKNPAKFAGNLLNALKGGFKSFAGNAPKHLQTGLGQWLTGASGITLPAKLDLQGVFMTALSVMGLTYQAMRGRLVKAMGPNGEKQVRAAEGTLDALKTLMGGLHKSGEMKANQAPVGNEVVAGLKSEVTKSVVMAGITKVASMLIPGGGFVQALIGAFRSVQFVIEQGKQIMGVITSAVQSVGAIAEGNIGAAVKGVESTLARSIPVALGFLGKVLGLGNIGAKVKTVIGKVRGKLEALLDKAVARIKKLIGTSRKPAVIGTQPTTSREHDRAVRAGLDDIPRLEAKYTVKGVLPKNAAKRVAKAIQQKHRIFSKVIAHVNQGERARYEWFASHGWEDGAKKLGARIDVQAELQAAKAAAPANWTAVFATGGKKLQCLPDPAGNTSLTLRRTWQESGRSTRSILDRLEVAMEKTLLASKPALSADRRLLEAEMAKLAQIVFSKIADRPLFYVKWTEIPRKLKPGPHMLVRDPSQKITKYADHAKSAMDDTLTGLSGEIHHAVSLYLGGGNSAKNLIAAVGKARIADTAHNILHDVLDTTVVRAALTGLADDYALTWSSLASTFDDSALKILIGTCTDDGDITYKETGVDFQKP
ncbi:DUF4157 domain-containing protein (plasmid) [Deinococcus taeanensis]|uniref:eCIS core domain-containing protein n=1 Tax=Deinococcus taeanensis TaxID=2737050 RepID=UPI001CDC6B5A|nr:DUF4157 domain-containing protein [Deinococcus taeanensis]UBV45355.1 DUF4157 domain-containing protein [Deinococcus taeanensis]